MTESIGYIGEIAKQSSEKRPVTVDYEDRLPTAVTVSSCAVAAYLLPGGTSDNSVISGTAASVDGDGLTASIYVRAGTSGRRYKVTFTATLSDTSVFEDDVLLIVEDV